MDVEMVIFVVVLFLCREGQDKRQRVRRNDVEVKNIMIKFVILYEYLNINKEINIKKKIYLLVVVVEEFKEMYLIFFYSKVINVFSKNYKFGILKILQKNVIIKYRVFFQKKIIINNN